MTRTGLSGPGQAHPRIDLPATLGDRLLDGASYLLTFFTISVTAIIYPSLPDIVPHHFDLAGNPDSFGSKSFVWFIPALSTFLTVLLSVIGRYPHSYNFPVIITEQNAGRQYRLAVTLIRWIKFWLAGFFTYTAWSTLHASAGTGSTISSWSAFFLVAALSGTIVLYFIRASGAK